MRLAGAKDPQTRERLEALRDGVRLAAIPTEHHADELAAALHAEFPWMAPATEAVWQAMRRSVRCGEPGLRLPPAATALQLFRMLKGAVRMRLPRLPPPRSLFRLPSVEATR